MSFTFTFSGTRVFSMFLQIACVVVHRVEQKSLGSRVRFHRYSTKHVKALRLAMGTIVIPHLQKDCLYVRMAWNVSAEDEKVAGRDIIVTLFLVVIVIFFYRKTKTDSSACTSTAVFKGSSLLFLYILSARNSSASFFFQDKRQQQKERWTNTPRPYVGDHFVRFRVRPLRLAAAENQWKRNCSVVHFLFLFVSASTSFFASLLPRTVLGKSGKAAADLTVARQRARG